MRRLILLYVLLAGCASLSPPLMPAAKGPSTSGTEVIKVIVKPIVTKGIGSEDEKKWGVDLSAHFTAFEVRVANGTKKELSFKPLDSYLIDDQNRKYHALDKIEGIRYYLEGDQRSIFTLIPKSEGKVRRETDKIERGLIVSGPILPGRQKEGLLLFKKISAEHCKEVVLELNGITVVDSGEEKSFMFPFTCKEEG